LNYRYVLFDLDGTLTQSEEGIVKSVAYALEKLGHAVPPLDELKKYIGPPLVDSFMQYEGMDYEKANLALATYRERFSTIGWKENMVYPGMEEVLWQLKKAGAYVAVASSKPLLFVENILEYFGIRPYFDKVCAVSMDESASLTKCQLIRAALPEDADYSRACMVGDRKYDVQGAREAGVCAIGALYGYGSREELEQAGADVICESVAELRRALLGDIPMRPGKFITFEGIDGSGKSTQHRMAQEYLSRRGYYVITTREPGGCKTAERIREILLDVGSAGMSPECEMLLFAAARAEHMRQVVIPALEEGKIVLCDRFLDSSIAYQAYGRELGEQIVRQINEPAVKGSMPDRTYLFNADTRRAHERVLAGAAPDRIESEKEDFVGRVYRGFQVVAQAEPDRVCVVDANNTIDAVFEAVKKDLDALLK